MAAQTKKEKKRTKAPLLPLSARKKTKKQILIAYYQGHRKLHNPNGPEQKGGKRKKEKKASAPRLHLFFRFQNVSVF